MYQLYFIYFLQTYKWPSEENEVTYKDYCRKYIVDDYPLGQLCKQIPGVNFDQEITTCVEDIKVLVCNFLYLTVTVLDLICCHESLL